MVLIGRSYLNQECQSCYDQSDQQQGGRFKAQSHPPAPSSQIWDSITRFAPNTAFLLRSLPLSIWRQRAGCTKNNKERQRAAIRLRTFHRRSQVLQTFCSELFIDPKTGKVGDKNKFPLLHRSARFGTAYRGHGSSPGCRLPRQFSSHAWCFPVGEYHTSKNCSVRTDFVYKP